MVWPHIYVCVHIFNSSDIFGNFNNLDKPFWADKVDILNICNSLNILDTLIVSDNLNIRINFESFDNLYSLDIIDDLDNFCGFDSLEIQDINVNIILRI